MADTENTEIVNEEVEQSADDNAPAEPQASLSLEELGGLLQIVDLAVSRGAFRGAEASQVGAVFDRLQNFLNVVAANQQAEADMASTEEGDAPAEPVEDMEVPAPEGE
jgi:hypothetical protein